MANGGGYVTVAAEEMEELRRRNKELSREVEEMKTEMIKLCMATNGGGGGGGRATLLAASGAGGRVFRSGT
ncbi:unnamed protein product [Arabidopsis arenosa]|uniref:Uncharacterized protein n=1 Tax=Arabidopsis arenosa TaxID=38785 RepID=A0A8S2AE73_ARAAE|nr:unnamed protein product [Arabidopsis arenosa]